MSGKKIVLIAMLSVLIIAVCVMGAVLISNRQKEKDKKFEEELIGVDFYLFKNMSNGKYGYIDKDGNVLIEAKYDWAAPFREERASVSLGKKYAVISKLGKYVLRPMDGFVGSFYDGRAVIGKTVNGQRKYGFIDRNGKIVIPIEYDNATDFNEGIAKALSTDLESWYIDIDGHRLLQCVKSYNMDFSEGLTAFEDGEFGPYGYMDKTGKYVIEPQFYQAGNFSEGMARIALTPNAKKYGYINKEGEVIIPAIYEDAQDFSEGLASVAEVVEEGKFGYIDKTGKYVLGPGYTGGSAFQDGVASVGVDGLVAVIDKEGNYVIEPQEYRLKDYYKGMFVVSNKDEYFYVNLKGERIDPKI